MKLLLFLVVLMVPAFSALGQETVGEVKEFSRPTIIAVALPAAPNRYREVYEDDDFLFAYRDYGYADSAPGFFAYSKKRDRWIKIVELSTEHATLGRSPTVEEVAIPPQVSWNYEQLQNQSYIKLPLPTSGSINFPNKIVYDASARLYCFGFNWCWNTEVAKTKLWVLKKDLEMAFQAAAG